MRISQRSSRSPRDRVTVHSALYHPFVTAMRLASIRGRLLSSPALWSTFPALIVALGAFLLLVVFVAADPAAGFTFSTSPWTDEAWNALGARNLVLLGRWSTDQWNLYLVEAPFSLLMAAAFKVFGVGIIQARVVCIGLVSLTALTLGLGLRRPLGVVPATVAALSLVASPLILYYGRLVYLESLVLLAMTAGTVTLARVDADPVRWGLAGGVGLSIAIGTKASAILPVAGLLAGVVLYGWIVDRRYLRWSAGALATLALAAAAWVLVIYLPHRSEVADDLLILAPISLPQSLAALGDQLRAVPRTDGILVLARPLLLVGVTGALIALIRPDSRAGPRGALLFGAIGWLVVGGGAIALFTYRPNRYWVPVLPPLAILVAIGLSVALPWLRGRSGPWLRAVIASAAALVLVAPGVVAYRSWMRHATYSLPAIQAQVRSLIPPGATAYGALAPALLMTAPVVTIARTVGAQSGVDLYTTRGVRWFVASRAAVIEPVALLHPGAWATRVPVLCSRWTGDDVCLFRLP